MQTSTPRTNQKQFLTVPTGLLLPFGGTPPLPFESVLLLCIAQGEVKGKDPVIGEVREFDARKWRRSVGIGMGSVIERDAGLPDLVRTRGGGDVDDDAEEDGSVGFDDCVAAVDEVEEEGLDEEEGEEKGKGMETGIKLIPTYLNQSPPDPPPPPLA